MICFPNAKINIGLNIVEKRKDGFHSIESIFQSIDLCDVLEIIEDAEQSPPHVTFTHSGIEIPGNSNDNLCIKAYELMCKKHSLPAIKVHLHKNIPIGAGLGGGSADAAFFIQLLNKKFNLNLRVNEMEHYAARLGSDCSYFVTNKPAYCTQKGDVHAPIDLDLSAYHFVLVNPNLHINTAQAYAGVKPKASERNLAEDIKKLPIEKWKDHIHNDFEDSLFPQFPEIKNIKEKLYSLGALYASMSGSGSTVYGIFSQSVDIEDTFKDYFVWQGKAVS